MAVGTILGVVSMQIKLDKADAAASSFRYGSALIATLVSLPLLALLALALRFVPYSDDRGNFDPIWTALMVVVIVAAIAVSVYLVIVLEIVKLKRSQNTQP